MTEMFFVGLIVGGLMVMLGMAWMVPVVSRLREENEALRLGMLRKWSVGGRTVSWDEAELIVSEWPVYDALERFSSDSTEDNAIGVVLAVMNRECDEN